MVRWPTRLVNRLRQPEYTGANRCTLCTLMNVLLAAVLIFGLTALLAEALPLLALGIVVSNIALALLVVIYLRGYLVPGTPIFTEMLFPVWLLQWFEKKQSIGGGESADKSDIKPALKTMEIVTECADVDDLCLTDDFREHWEARMSRLQADDTSREVLSSILGVDNDVLVFKEYGEAVVASHGGRQVGRWESRAALVADVAAAQELQSRSAKWKTLGVQQRSRVLHRLRIFLEDCPLCAGPVSVNREVSESCCRSLDVLVMSCEDCDARILEAEQQNT